jgi:zinc D-Ala-D-Ala carboxypeptidase
MNQINLSEHFTLAEATYSPKAIAAGIDNCSPTDPIVTSACRTAVKMEKVRVTLGFPIDVSSWIRSPKLNTLLGSKPTSQHLKGEAVDFTCPEYGTPTQICNKLLGMKDLLKWDQLILEHTWVHISWNSVPGAVQRCEVLSLLASGGYANGLTDANGNSVALA